MPGERILIIEDEAPIRKFLRVALEASGFEVREAATGVDGVGKCALDHPALVVTDLGLPDIDGKQVVSRIREWSSVPILVLSVRQAEDEKVAALDAGANDYVVKPFGIAELLARVRALLRSASAKDGQVEQGAITIKNLTVDFVRREVRLGGEMLRLTRKEFDLLKIFVQHAGRIVTHRFVLNEIWGPAHEEDPQYLRVFVGRLRQKLRDDPAQPRFILNEPGVGYRFLTD
jgi:two-component system, OmpR family, KDP operon response regulator KdpE